MSFFNRLVFFFRGVFASPAQLPLDVTVPGDGEAVASKLYPYSCDFREWYLIDGGYNEETP